MKGVGLFLLATFVAALINPLRAEATNETTPAAPEAATATPPENTTASSANTTVAPEEDDDFMDVHPLGKNCLDLYSFCTQEKASKQIEDNKYCDAYNVVESCVKKNHTTENATLSCTSDEILKLGILNCGPVTTMQRANNGSSTYNVSDACLAQITECLSSGPGLLELGTVYHFNQFFCDVGEAQKLCITARENSSTCTEAEYDTFYKASRCNFASTLLSSIPVIGLVLALHYLLG